MAQFVETLIKDTIGLTSNNLKEASFVIHALSDTDLVILNRQLNKLSDKVAAAKKQRKTLSSYAPTWQD